MRLNRSPPLRLLSLVSESTNVAFKYFATISENRIHFATDKNRVAYYYFQYGTAWKEHDRAISSGYFRHAKWKYLNFYKREERCEHLDQGFPIMVRYWVQNLFIDKCSEDSVLSSHWLTSVSAKVLQEEKDQKRCKDFWCATFVLE